MEDNDIKIFGKKPDESSVDEFALITEMNIQRSNGNTDKARQLSHRLSTLFVDEDGLLKMLEPVLGKIDYPKPIIYQMKILMFFTAEYCFNFELPNTLVKSTAINVLYDSIRDDASEFYQEFSDCAEYSFYYLAVKKPDVPKAIGKTFAMVCQKENDIEMQTYGERLFSVVLEEIKNIIDSYHFVK